MVDPQRLMALVEQAGAAHHAAFAATDGDDPDWPLWYARHLQGPLAALGVDRTVSELTHVLVAAELERRATADPPPWPQLYASRIADAPRL